MQQCIKIYYSIFIWSTTCFGRHTAHHQEPKTALAASGFAYVEGCWTCGCWTLTASSNHQQNGVFICLFACFWHNSPHLATASSFTRFLDHTERRTTDGRTPVDEWSSRCRHLYLTTLNKQNRHIHTTGAIRTHNLSRRTAISSRNMNVEAYFR